MNTELICGKDYETELRPLLAEFCGAEHKNGWYRFPGGKWTDFNPLHNHADCHALIEALNGAGYNVIRGERADGSRYAQIVKIGEIDAERKVKSWRGEKPQTTRKGVVTLAYPIAAETLAREEADQALHETLGQAPHGP